MFDGRDGIATLALRTGEELWIAQPSEPGVGYFDAAPGVDVVVAVEGTCDDSFEARGLVALDAATGDVRWRSAGAAYALSATHKLATYFSAVVPVDAGGVVVAIGDQLTLGLRAEDGSVAWSVSAAEDSPLGVTEDLVLTTRPAVPHVDEFRALDRRTGAVRWEARGWTDPFEIVAADSRHVVVATGGIGSQPYDLPVTLVVLDARAGKEQGRFDAGKPQLFYFSDVALTDGQVVYAEGRSIVGRRLPNGEQVWRRRFASDRDLDSMARSTDSRTVFALASGRDSRVTALDAATGQQRWTRSSNEDGFRSAGATASVFGDQHPSRALHSVGTSLGSPKWAYTIPSALTSPGLSAIDLTVGTAARRTAISGTCDDG